MAFSAVIARVILQIFVHLFARNRDRVRVLCIVADVALVLVLVLVVAFVAGLSQDDGERGDAESDGKAGKKTAPKGIKSFHAIRGIFKPVWLWRRSLDVLKFQASKIPDRASGSDSMQDRQ